MVFEARFHLHAAAVLAPGLPNLPSLLHAARLSKPVDPNAPFSLPIPQRLPPNERRRSSLGIRLALTCLTQIETQSPFPLSALRSVFATSDSTGEVSQKMFETLATTREVSPVTFTHSVHNAAAGYFSIAYQNTRSSSVVSQGRESFTAGLLCALIDALTLDEPILLVCFDPAMTGPMLEQLPLRYPAACAWVISAGTPRAPTLASFLLVEDAAAGAADPSPAWIPSCWTENSAALGFAALGLLSSPAPAKLNLSLGSRTLSLEIHSDPNPGKDT
jgi:hypothetical protein